MIHTIVSDLDGTLVHHDTFELHPRTIEAFTAAIHAGARVIVASGRSGASMRPYVEELCKASSMRDPYTACNGAEIYQGSEVLRQTLMTVDQQQAALKWLKSHGVYVQAYETHGFVYDTDCVYADNYTLSSGLPCRKVDDLAEYLDKPSVKLLGIDDDPDRIARLLAEGREMFAGVLGLSTSSPIFLEISHPEASKGNALTYLSQSLGFTCEGTLAFGDSLNDMPMLKWAGMSVAVDNARPEVKEVCTNTCDTCPGCGPAQYIEELLAQSLIGPPLK